MKEMLRYGLILGLICLVATGLLAAVNAVTKTRIAAEAQKSIDESLKAVLPAAETFETVQAEGKTVYYKGLDGGRALVGVAFVASGKGYASVIETMVGMTPDGTITAIKVMQQNETPGLGCRVNEVKDDLTLFDFMRGRRSTGSKTPWFCAQFRDRKVADLDSVQAITGATISSRAVINSVKQKSEEIFKLLKNE